MERGGQERREVKGTKLTSYYLSQNQVLKRDL